MVTVFDKRMCVVLSGGKCNAIFSQCPFIKSLNPFQTKYINIL